MTTTVKVIQHSVTEQDKEIITYELEYPGFIHAEFMTHRLFSRNSASSRAIPIKTMIDTIRTNPAAPIHWGANQAGMQAKSELTGWRYKSARLAWNIGMRSATFLSLIMNKLNVHKQIANRLTQPFQHMKVVMTTTEQANWDWLRDHEDAQPEIRELARKMIEARKKSTPMLLKVGEWHVPYVNRVRAEDGKLVYWSNSKVCTVEEAKQISASCCAQVSYRKADTSIKKAQMIFDKLINSKPVHASPVEHQATPIKMRTFEVYKEDLPNLVPKNIVNEPSACNTWQEGITHSDRNGKLWSGNFQGWIQYRQTISDQARW